MNLTNIIGTTDPTVMDLPELGEVADKILGWHPGTAALQEVSWDKGSYLLHVYVASIHPEQYPDAGPWEIGEFETTELHDPKAPGHWMGDDFREVYGQDGFHCYMHFIHGDGIATCFTVTG